MFKETDRFFLAVKTRDHEIKESNLGINMNTFTWNEFALEVSVLC